MDELRGKYIINQLQKKWAFRLLLADMLLLIGISLLISFLAVTLFKISWILLPWLLLAMAALKLLLFRKKITDKDVSNYLNKTFPTLQESTGLFLKPYEDLNFLERLQVQKMNHFLNFPILPPKNITKNIRLAISILLFSFFLLLIKKGYQFLSPLTKQEIAIQKIKETKPFAIESVTLTIVPPPYTKKATRQQDRLNVEVEEDGKVIWQINSSVPFKHLALVFNGKTELPLQPTNKNHTQWYAYKQVKSSGFYQIKIDTTYLELYQLEMIKDAAPVIVVHTPKTNTVIEPGQEQKTLIQVGINDDYGIKTSYLMATIASGNGEGVKFKNIQLNFNNFTPDNQAYNLKKLLDLPALGMKPGDELYFYISATDNHLQEKRSDIHILRLEDTEQLLSMSGLLNSSDIKPEFFRSQRQIIIETEQLLREKDSISTEAFKNRSNNLGIDQKLLRLRYGKFLGDESDAEEHHDEDHTSESDLGNAAKMIAEVSHKHDNAEDATFFDAQTKKQLKATLDEMWKSELQLRTIQPKQALPFEYKALKLLKDLQQQTRAFVSKTGIKTTLLKPEKRLTGELDKIIEPNQQRYFEQPEKEIELLRKAIGLLTQISNQEPLTYEEKSLLEKTAQQITYAAAASPATYLPTLKAIRKILHNNYQKDDLILAGSSLQKMVGSLFPIPQQATKNIDGKLSDQYFKNLQLKHE